MTRALASQVTETGHLFSDQLMILHLAIQAQWGHKQMLFERLCTGWHCLPYHTDAFACQHTDASVYHYEKPPCG